MMVLVDTPVWSLALRRKPSDLKAHERVVTTALEELIRDGRAQIIGVIRQELLSGIREEDRFRKLRDYLRAFDDPALETSDHEEAARMHNQCRRRGVAGSAIDFLISAVAHRRGWQIFTTDRDFERYGKVLRVKLYGVPSDEKMLLLARKRDFIREFDSIMNEPLVVSDAVINMEDNLNSTDLRKGLFSVGFSVDVMQPYEKHLNELVKRRNSIAHGIDDAIVRGTDYTRVEALEKESYLKQRNSNWSDTRLATGETA
jgi:hypothetical protein